MDEFEFIEKILELMKEVKAKNKSLNDPSIRYNLAKIYQDMIQDMHINYDNGYNDGYSDAKFELRLLSLLS